MCLSVISFCFFCSGWIFSDAYFLVKKNAVGVLGNRFTDLIVDGLGLMMLD